MSVTPHTPPPADQPASFRQLQEFTRRVLAVPKKEIDRKLAREKLARKKRKS